MSGGSGAPNPSGVKTIDALDLLEFRQDTATPGRTIEGWAALGSAQTAAVWRIRATDVVGTQTHRFYQDNNINFDNVWSDRNTNLPNPAFLNEFSFQLSGATNANLSVVDSADIDFANTDAFSISLYWKGTAGGTQILMQKATNTGGNNGYTVTLDSSGRIQLEFRGTGTGDRIRVRTDSFTSGNDGNWHHLMITKASGSALASSVTIYVDGTDETLNVLNDTLTGATTSAASLFFGSNVSGAATFTGNIDEFAIWGAELTPTEVAEVYNTNSGSIDLQAGSTQIASALNAWWRFGDGSFSALTTVPDEEGSNDATAGSAITSGDIETEVPP